MGPLMRHRRPTRRVRWVLTLAVAVVAGAAAAGAVQRTQDVRAAFGTRLTVPVAATDLDLGRTVGPDDVRWAELPAGAVPPGAAADPVGRTVVEAVAAGEVVLDRRLSPVAGPDALAPPGGRAIAVPTDQALPALGVGDRVDAFTPADVVGSGTLADVAGARSAGATRVARDAVVLAVDEAAVTIAVAPAEAAGVARAVLDGALTLARITPG